MRLSLFLIAQTARIEVIPKGTEDIITAKQSPLPFFFEDPATHKSSAKYARARIAKLITAH